MPLSAGFAGAGFDAGGGVLDPDERGAGAAVDGASAGGAERGAVPPPPAGGALRGAAVAGGAVRAGCGFSWPTAGGCEAGGVVVCGGVAGVAVGGGA